MLTSKLLSPTLNTKIYKQIGKCLATKLSNANDFIPVYSFPHIRSFTVINKAKLYLTLGTCIGIPCSYALSAADLCSPEIFAGISAVGVSGCMLLHTLGLMISNTVGIIYLHKDSMTTKISYMDTWGSRRDALIELNEIVPFSEQPMALTDPLYISLQQYTSKQKFKLNVRYGVVLNTDKFAKIFHKK